MTDSYLSGAGVTGAAAPVEEIPVEEAPDLAVRNAELSGWDAAKASQSPVAPPSNDTSTAAEVPVEDADAPAPADPGAPAPAAQSTVDYQAEQDQNAYEQLLAYKPPPPTPAKSYAPVVNDQGEQVADPRMAEQEQVAWDAAMAQPAQTEAGSNQLERQGEQIIADRQGAQYGLDEQGNPLPPREQGNVLQRAGEQITGTDGFQVGDLNPINLIKGGLMGAGLVYDQPRLGNVSLIGQQALDDFKDGYGEQEARKFIEARQRANPTPVNTGPVGGLLAAAGAAKQAWDDKENPLQAAKEVGSATLRGAFGDLVASAAGETYDEWLYNPENYLDINRVAKEGYQGLSGPDAVFQYFQDTTTGDGLGGMVQRGVRDIAYDPLTVPSAAIGAAAEGVNLGARGVGLLPKAAKVASIAMDPLGEGLPAVAKGLSKVPGVQPAFDATIGKPIRYLAGATEDATNQIDAAADTQLFAELSAQARRQGGLTGDAGDILEPVVTPPATPGGATTVEIRKPDGSVVPFDPDTVLDNLSRLDLADYQPEFRKWFEFMKVGNPYGLPHTIDTMFPTTATGGTAAYNNYIDLMAKRVLRYGEDVYDGMYNGVRRTVTDAARRPGQWYKVGYELDAIQNVQRRSGVPYTAGGDAAALTARQNLDIRWRNESIRNSAPRPGRPTPPITYTGPMPWTPSPAPLPTPRGPFDSGGLIFSPEDIARLSREVKGQPVYQVVDQARRDLEEARDLAAMTARNPAQDRRLNDLFTKYNVPGLEIRGAADAVSWAELDDATIDAMAASWGRREVEIATGLRTKKGTVKPPAYYGALNNAFPKLGSALQAYDRVSNTPRTLLLYNFLNAPGFFGRQVLGNTATLGLTGPDDSLRNFFRLGDWRTMAKRGAGGPRAVDTAADEIRRASGLGTAGVLRRGGPLPDAATAADSGLARFLAPKQLRALVEIPDLQVRESVWRAKFEPAHARLRQQIRQHATDRAPGFGVSVTRGQVDATLDALEADALARTGRLHYSAEDLRAALEASPATAPTPEAKRDWADRVARDFLGAREDDAATGFKGLRQIDQEALNEAQRVGFGGPETRADAILSRIFFYHTWSSRAGLTYARELMRNPTYASAYYRAIEGLNREADQGDYPPFLRATIRLMGTEPGFNAYVRGPESIFGTMLTAAEDQFRDPNAPEYQRVSDLGTLVDRAPFMVNPWLVAAMYVPGLLGADAQSPSPLGTSGMWGRIIDGVNLYRASQDQPLVPRSWRPEPAVLNYVANLVSGWAKQAGLPVEQVSKINWDAQGTTNRRWFVQQVLRDSHPEWTEDEILAEAMEIQDDLENPVTQAAIDLEARMPYSGPRLTGTLDNAPDALRNIAGGLYQALGPLPATVRPTIKDQNQALRGDIAQLKREQGLTQDQAIKQLGITPEQADQLYLANEIVTAADPEMLQFKRTMDAYRGYGTPEQLRLDGTYQMISGGTLTGPIDANGRTWTPEEVAALPEDRRKQLARVYLADQGKLDEWEAYKDGKEAFKQANPDLVGYYDFKNFVDAYKGGPDAWAAQTRTGNRSFDLYIREQEQVDPDTIPLTDAERRTLPAGDIARRDKARIGMLTSPDAYFAALGQARTVYDVNDPRPSGDYGPYLAGVPAGTSISDAPQPGSGVGGTGGQSTYEEYRAEQTQYLEEDLQNFAGMVQIMNDYDAQVGDPIGTTRDIYVTKLLTGNKKLSLPGPVYDEIKATYEYVWPTKGKLKDFLGWYFDPNANPNASESIDDFLDYDSLQSARQDLNQPIPVPGSDTSLATITGNRQKVVGADGTWSWGTREAPAATTTPRQVTVKSNTPLLIDYNNPLAQAGMAMPGLPLVDLNQPAVGRDRNFRLVEGPGGQRFWVDAAMLKAA